MGVQFNIAEYVKKLKTKGFNEDFFSNAYDFLYENDLDGMNLELEGNEIPIEDFDVIIKSIETNYAEIGVRLTVSFRMPQNALFMEYNFLALSDLVEFISFNPTYNTGNFNYTIDDAQEDRALPRHIKSLVEKLGVPPSKILVGLQFGGPRFIQTEREDDVKSEKFDKMLNYQDICNASTEINWEFSFSEDFNMLTMTNETIGQRITFESPRTFVNQIRFAMHEKLAGVFTGLLNDDNYLGNCGVREMPFNDFLETTQFPISMEHLPGIYDETNNISTLLQIIINAIRIALYEIEYLSTHKPRGELGIFAPPIRISHKPIVQSTNTENVKLARQSDNGKLEIEIVADDELDINNLTNNNNPQNITAEGLDNDAAALFEHNAHCIVLGVIITLSPILFI